LSDSFFTTPACKVNTGTFSQLFKVLLDYYRRNVTAGSSWCRRCSGWYNSRRNCFRDRLFDDVTSRQHVVVRRQHGAQDGRVGWARSD